MSQPFSMNAGLHADLVRRLPLTQEQWQLVPAPCPHLERALPAVAARSTVEAGWLVGRLAADRRARLRTAALSLAELRRLPALPAELSQRILVLALQD